MQSNHSRQSKPLSVNPTDDRWLRIVGVPLAVLPFVFFYIREYGFNGKLVLLTFTWGLISTTAAWELLRWWVFRIRRLHSHKDQTKRRVLLTFGGYILFTALMQPLETWGLSQIDPTGIVTTPEYPRVYLTHIFMALSFATIVGGYYEITYYLHLYRLALTEGEALKKARLQNQFDTLKNQVNPHFLFNSLNSLSALVRDDPERATEFLDELATVYRYLLQTNQSPLVSLNVELSFLQSYMYLLQTRYGDALCLGVRVDETEQERYLPPLTLQTLVENAIRHNIIDVERPLRISLSVSGNLLTVTNPIQRKHRPVETQRGGLMSLTNRFSSLSLMPPLITDDGQYFRVEVPLALRNPEKVVSLS